jgi:hypothetical protein
MLTTITNVNYASFPVKEKPGSEVIISIESKNDPWYKTDLFKISLVVLCLIAFSIDANIGSIIGTPILLYYLIGFIKRVIYWDLTPYSLWEEWKKRLFWILLSLFVLFVLFALIFFSDGPMM